MGVEISLDVQVAHEICQNCKILLVEATSASFANLAKAENTAVAKGANVVSNSYGSYGADSTIGGTGLSAYDHPGHAIVVAAGDSGFGPSYPADLNTVVAVGGTSLRMSGGAYLRETTWNNSPTSATGSGCDDTSLARTWQRAVTRARSATRPRSRTPTPVRCTTSRAPATCPARRPSPAP